MAIYKNPTMMRARELVIQLRSATGPDPGIDRAICELFRWHPARPTGSLDEANRMVKRYYQRGLREYRDGTWSAYVEVNSGERKGFIWANHRCEPIALAIAALESHIAEMSEG